MASNGVQPRAAIVENEREFLVKTYEKVKIYDVKTEGEGSSFYKSWMEHSSNYNSPDDSNSNEISSSSYNDDNLEEEGFEDPITENLREILLERHQSINDQFDIEQSDNNQCEVTITEQIEDEVMGSLRYREAINYWKREYYNKAFRYFKLAADVHCYTSASFAAGVCYEIGVGADQNYKKAEKYYIKASDGGHWKAKYNLANLIFNEYIDGTVETGLSLLKEACLSKSAKVENEYASRLFEQNSADPQIVLYLQEAANKKHPQALFNLGVCYEQGLGGANKDLSVAVTLYTEASRLGEPNAKYNLAECAKHGLVPGMAGLEQDLFQWRDLVNQSDQLFQGQQQLSGGQQQLSRGQQQLSEGQQQLSEGQQQLSGSQQQLSEGQQQFSEGQQQLSEGQQQFFEGQQQLSEGQQLLSEDQQQLSEGQRLLSEDQQQLPEGQHQSPVDQQQLSEGQQQFSKGQQQLSEGQQQLTNLQELSGSQVEFNLNLMVSGDSGMLGCESRKKSEAPTRKDEGQGDQKSSESNVEHAGSLQQ